MSVSKTIPDELISLLFYSNANLHEIFLIHTQTYKILGYESLTESIRKMDKYLQSEGVIHVAMESTSILSDVKDAQRIATLLHKGLLRGSMVPCSEITELRIYTRRHTRLVQRSSQILTEMDRIMVTANKKNDKLRAALTGNLKDHHRQWLNK